MLPLREADDDTRRGWLVAAWRAMDERQRFAWNKLLTGEFRVGVSQNLVVRALAEVSGVSTETIAHRLMGDWPPTAESWERLTAPETGDSDVSRPYPFCLAYPLEGRVEDLGERRTSGRSSGNGTASGHSSFAGSPAPSYGRAARS